ncbi:PHD and RING finger domain-containing protein 1 isoform X1 [Phycodurus eques]|uniref:PHD and RING finger domain-containing protein 1 isoform X1 n=1 Tax=Phycodurus eques TaxID=693459 RepID=UPI002ACEB007|nr:PHD and RING finger domain-containing protein 1 isoform X1 [Phycodurus eques]XP_061533604.1 PHD and RING finger domain-containing protein 1 isoform X1 [Phycodurus eques]
MDDDDSPDEVTNRRVCSKKTVPRDISDSDDEVDGSEADESAGSDEEEGDDDDEEEEGEENDEEYDEDEEDAEAEDGILGETSAAVTGMSSDEDADKCPICLNTFSNQPVATPENCEHYFCLDCILAWAKNANSCPVDRIAFNSISLRKSYGGKVQKIITVQKPLKEDVEVTVDLDLEQTNCEVCQGSDREDRLLLCDGCDAGYHMECLTPPLDTVPVEEWFCPECVANNNYSAFFIEGSTAEQNRSQSLPSTAQPTTSRSQSRAAGPTRAIARTQHSERVRANVNRHRITQARTSQFAPTYQIQSTWLDETINAVVAGLNTAVYVRDLTPHALTRRRRKTGTRRKVTKKKAFSVKGKKGGSTRRRRKRKGRRTKSKRTLVGKKLATPQSRIANSLGLSKDKKNCSLPTVCRPSEHTLSSMRADIGAASLSIYGDPFDLDPFIDREEDEQEETVVSLLEAKRRGISHSAFRSHQPVARPVSAGLSSRRSMDVPQTGGVVEATPVPDLLGSILSGQSLLLMDSSDVVISRDGSLKSSQSAASLSTLKSDLRERSSSEESNAMALPVVSGSLGECSSSNHYSRHQLGPTYSNLNRSLSQCSSLTPSDVNHIQPPHYPDLPPRGHLCFQLPLKNQSSPSFGIQITNGVSREGAPSSCKDSVPSSYSKNTLSSQSQPTKAPPKPMWMDVDILPRIPKLKRDAVNDGNRDTNKSNGSSPTGNNSGMPETALINFAGDKNRQQHVAQQSNTDRQPQNQGAGSSQAFSNSFSFSSSTFSPTPLCNSSVSSSSSSSISFRINASGNSWHSRRLSLSSSFASGSSTQGDRREKMDQAKKRKEHRDKQKLLASRTTAGNKQDFNIYDPFNPTMSDSSGSDSEGENLGSSCHQFRAAPSSAFTHYAVQSEQKLVGVKTETHESEASQEEPRDVETPSRVVSCASGIFKVERKSMLVDAKTVNRAALSGIKVKKEPGKDMFAHDVKSSSGSETPVMISPVQHSLGHIKTEEEIGQSAISSKNAPNNKKIDSSGSCSITVKLKEEIKSDPNSPPRDLGHDKKNSSTAVPSKQQRSESDKGKTKDYLVSNQGDRQKKMGKDRERRSRSRERRKCSLSESSQSNSPKSAWKKRRQRSRSGSRSSSRERSRRKKQEQKSRERTDGNESGREKRRVSNDGTYGQSRSRSRSRGRYKDQRSGRSRSKSPSSPYKSRSKERRKERTHLRHEELKPQLKDKTRPRSRSSSRERRKVGGSFKNHPKNSESCFSSTIYHKDTKKENEVSLSSVKKEQFAEVKKEPTFAAEVKKEDDSEDNMATSGIKKEIQVIKKVKKEELQSIDMFQHSPIATHTKEETTHGMKKEPVEIEVCKMIKTEEACENSQIKAEPVFLDLPVTLPQTLSSLQEVPDHFQPDVKAPVDQAKKIEWNVPKEQPPESDEDISMDMVLDSLDCVKQELTEDIGANIKQEVSRQEGKTEAKQVPAASKVKIQGKRVTWNIQEPDGVQPGKSLSKLALYKRKLKQEAAHRPSSKTSGQDTSGPGSVSDSSKGDNATLPTGTGCQAYLKKLHMQERAVEEVKLAIKPFYQKRNITKEEYKEILRKAVQKVCHSKSGEINPVKVANLVKAYVHKYKHARKHQTSETEATKVTDGH